jgi:transposase
MGRSGQTFQLYVEKVLVPTLQQGDIVIMDNLDSHKGKAVRRAIRGAGARLFYLPKYSPDLNPIEQFFAKVKNIGFAKLLDEPPRPSTRQSVRSSTPSHRMRKLLR